MSSQVEDAQETIAMSPEPAAPFTDRPAKEWRDLFFSLPETTRELIVPDMDRSELEAFIDLLDPDEVTDVLGYADEGTREALLATLEGERREKIEFLLSFDPETAAGVMDLDFVTVDESRSFSDVTERVRRFGDRTGRVPTILVTDEDELLGELPGAALSVADRETETITDFVQETPHVRYDREDEEVLEVFRQNRERTVAVLDDDDDVLGVIHASDLLAMIEEARGETLYEFTGVAEEESVLDGPIEKVRRRYKWLILNLGTAFMAAAVVGLFESTIAAVAILAAYMPVVAGMGGNAGRRRWRSPSAASRWAKCRSKPASASWPTRRSPGPPTGSSPGPWSPSSPSPSRSPSSDSCSVPLSASRWWRTSLSRAFSARSRPCCSIGWGTIPRRPRPSSSPRRRTCWAFLCSSVWPRRSCCRRLRRSWGGF